MVGVSNASSFVKFRKYGLVQRWSDSDLLVSVSLTGIGIKRTTDELKRARGVDFEFDRQRRLEKEDPNARGTR